MRRQWLLAVGFGFLALSGRAFAAASTEDRYLLVTGAGVSDPSALHGFRDNPAGMSQLQRVKLQAIALTQSTQFNPITGGVHVLLGNGTFGGGVGLEMNVPGALAPAIIAGLGVSIKPIKTAIGLSCQASLASGITVSCSQLGLLFNPEGGFKVGLQTSLASIAAGSFPIGAGLSLDLGKIVTLALDASTQIGGAGAGGFVLMPALGVHVAIVDLTAGYGIPLLSANGAAAGGIIRTGFAAGAGVAIGKVLYATLHYNHYGLLFAGLTARF